MSISWAGGAEVSPKKALFPVYGVSKKFDHAPQLDGLRALAVSIVFFAHVGFRNFVPGGFGVTLFFFLSGYLITSLLLVEFNNDNSVSIKNFYLRRFYRILPPLYLSMLFALILSYFNGSYQDLKWQAILSQVFMLSNYIFFSDGASLNIPLWSLAVEEHYYLIYPFIFTFCIKNISKSSIAFLFICACILSLVFRLYYSLMTDLSVYIYFWSHTRFDSILYGCILALWRNPLLDQEPWRPRGSVVIVAVLVLIACLVIRNNVFRDTVRYSFQGMSLLIIFNYVLSHNNIITNFLSSRILSRVGLYSYCLYLLHLPIIRALEKYFPTIHVAVLAISSGTIAIFLAHLMNKYVEVYFSRLRKRLHSDKNVNIIIA